MFIKIVESEYLTGDKDVDNYLERFLDVYIFNILIFRRLLNSTNNEKISKFLTSKRKPIGFRTEEHEDKD